MAAEVEAVAKEVEAVAEEVEARRARPARALRWQQSWTKCAPLTAESEKRTPSLATTPTAKPSMCAKPHTSESP